MERGDIVRLKSGGPSMTVLEIGEKTTRCQWFTLFGEIKDQVFANDTIQECGPCDIARELASFLGKSKLNVDIW
jgi:uncharacterized protein YodC (DUF2158 family)